MGMLVYYPGGAQVSESWDDATETYTAYAPDGTVAQRRPYTAAEVAAATAEQNAQRVAAKIATAQQGIVDLHAQVPLLHNQLAADIATVQAGWDRLTADQRTAIMLRILNGFGTAMAGLLDHATVTGAIPPA